MEGGNIIKAFPPPSGEDEATICERNAAFLAAVKPDEVYRELSQSKLYPDIDVATDLLRPCMSRESARSAFLEHEETGIVRFKRAWYEEGFTGVIQEVAEVQPDKNSWLAYMAYSILATIQWFSTFHGILKPNLKKSAADIVAEYSPNTSWMESYVKVISWHPSINKLALGLRDDSIKVYQHSRPDFVPVLKHKQQRSIADLAWRPNNASMLAVACQTGVIVWSIEPLSLATRPSSGAATVWKYPGHAPVTAVAWQPKGRFLLSASPNSHSIMVWSVDTGEKLALHRWSGGGFVGLFWSPDCNKLLATCPAPEFRIFDAMNWDSERWTRNPSRIQAACWSPEGDLFLFVPADETIIYAVALTDTGRAHGSHLRSTQNRAVPIANVAKIDMERHGKRIMLGGRVKSMIWDKTGERLAMMFSGPGSSHVAVFQTRLYPSVELIPSGFVKGYADENPEAIGFCPAFNEGALLTVAWSSGRVSHVPLYYLSQSALKEGQVVRRGQHHVPLQNLYSLKKS